MRSDEEIKTDLYEIEVELREAEWRHDWQESEELQAELHRLKLELRDPAALLPDRDLRTIDDLID